jgi:Fe-S-cluster containining protein
VEALSIALALRQSPPEKSERIRELAAAATLEKCPLLENGRCLLYEARPIICRTHGFPLLTLREGEKVLDFCPLNFKGVSTFPSNAILDLDLLNATLAAINAVFIASVKEGAGFCRERMTMAEALLLNL